MVRAYFDRFPNSTIYLRRVRRFYIVYSLDWHADDPLVNKEDREEMQELVNRELGREKEYNQRKSRSI